MDKNKLIILLLTVVIIILAVGLFTVMNQEKEDTILTIECNSTIHEGDSINVKLTDENGTPISNQKINVSITDVNKASSYYSVVTDENGVGTLGLDKSEGNYTVNCSYNGNRNYDGSKAVEKITIEKAVVKEISSTQSTSYSNQESSQSSSSDSRPAVDSSGITREEADEYGWTYTPDHGGHYIGSMDAWDEEAGVYHD